MLPLNAANGVLIRTGVASISTYGRSSQGVRVMNLEEDNKVIGIVAVEAEPESEETDGEDGENTETAENIPQTETEQEYTEE